MDALHAFVISLIQVSIHSSETLIVESLNIDASVFVALVMTMTFEYAATKAVPNVFMQSETSILFKAPLWASVCEALEDEFASTTE